MAQNSEMVLAQLAAALAAAQTTEQLARPLLQLLEHVTGLESTYLTRVDEAAGQQLVLFAHNSKSMQIPEGLTVPWGDTLCKRALDEGRPFTLSVADHWGDSEAAKALKICTYTSTPIYLDGGVLYGTLCGASDQEVKLSGSGFEILSLFGLIIQQALRREFLVEQLRDANARLEVEASFDSLTALPNRRAVFHEMAQLLAAARIQKRYLFVCFIDLDGFKAINDKYGHETGDHFLIEVGRRLSQVSPGVDVLGRIGGDEFVRASLGPLLDEDPAPSLEGFKIQAVEAIEGRYNLPAIGFDYGGASVGGVAIDAQNCTPEEAIRAADRAMYKEKRMRRGVTETRS